MAKIDKVRQFLTLAITAYTLYKTVSEFLETDTGKAVKAKALDYYATGKEKVNEYIQTNKRDSDAE